MKIKDIIDLLKALRGRVRRELSVEEIENMLNKVGLGTSSIDDIVATQKLAEAIHKLIEKNKQ